MQLISPLASEPNVGGAGSPVKVLIVDDRPENLLAIEAILEPLGETLVRANSGQEALSKLLTSDFALVLLDVSMPGMDGFETATRIKERRKTSAIPIIFLTANNPDERLILRGYEAGAVDYLFKPLTPEVVRSKVSVFCELYRSRERTRAAAADIARAQAAAAEAKEGEKKLADVLERISDAFFALDAGWRFTYVNEKAALLLHRQRADLLGKVIWEEFPETATSAFYDQYRRAVETQSAIAFADYYPPLDSWFEVHAYPSPEGISVYFADASEKQRAQRMLQESERRFRSLVEATTAAVWKLDKTGLFVAEEDDWHQLTGQAFEEMRGTGWLGAVHPEDRARTETAWKKAFSAGSIFEVEHRVRTRDGEYREMFARAVPVFDATGKIEEWVGTHTDITARKHAERQRDLALEEALDARETAERAQQEAEMANRGKSEFLATMSHEFRTPLNAILGYTQLIDMGVLGAVTIQQHDHLQRLRASAVHLLGLVNDILDLSKIEAGRVHVARETAYLSDVIQATRALVAPQAVARGIDYPEECAGEKSVSYVGDPDRVRQILVNLLSNAVKFTNPGGSVTLTCGTADHADPGARLVGDGQWTYVRVTDTGIGIPIEQVVRIFEPFVQAETGYTRTEGGTGLGLSISRRLARLMGGDITVQSKIGEGSTFTLWLRSPSSDEVPHQTDEHSIFQEASPAVDVDAMKAVASMILTRIGDVATTYVRRLRDDKSVPDVSALSDAQLRDHADTVIAEIVRAATLLAETKGRGADLLRDGAEIQRLLAELHGAQRFRLAWTETEVARDVDLLSRELRETVESLDADADAVRFFSDVVPRILEQWKQTSIRGYRFAKAAGKR
ncbi:MAG TPA: ATP-binding protein [Gemmatimonadaceae bacterium]